MQKLSSFILALLLFASGLCQNKGVDEAVVRSIAGYILEHTTLAYRAVESRTIYHSTEEIQEDVEVRFVDQFTEWGYTMGVLDLAAR